MLGGFNEGTKGGLLVLKTFPLLAFEGEKCYFLAANSSKIANDAAD